MLVVVDHNYIHFSIKTTKVMCVDPGHLYSDLNIQQKLQLYYLNGHLLDIENIIMFEIIIIFATTQDRMYTQGQQ